MIIGSANDPISSLKLTKLPISGLVRPLSGVFVTDAGQSSQVLFRADHPFIYVISEAGSGAVLFAGRFGNEKAE